MTFPGADDCTDENDGGSSPKLVLTAEQAAVIDRVENWLDKPGGGLFGLSGPAGTGKTTCLRALAERLSGRWAANIAWSAMTGKAALRAREAAGVPARTFHSTFYYAPGEDEERTTALTWTPRQPRNVDGPITLLVVDEASMMGPTILGEVEREWVAKGVKVLLVGDGFQLPPVMTKAEEDAHGADFSVFAKVETASLTTCMRSVDDILWAANEVRVAGQVPRASRGAYQYVPGPIYRFAVAADERVSGCGLITWRNEVRMEANKRIRRRRGRIAPTPEPGEPILIRQNGYGRMNGELMIVGEARPIGAAGPIELHEVRPDGGGESFTAYFGDMSGQMPYLGSEDFKRYRIALRREDWKPPIPVTWGYALTAHLAQGSEYDHVGVFMSSRDGVMAPMRRLSLLPDGTRVPFWRRFLYTAMTRAKRTLMLVVGEED